MQLEDAKYAVIALVTLGIILTVAALISDSFKSSVSTNYKENKTLAPANDRENFSAVTETYAIKQSKVVQSEFTVYNVTGVDWKNTTVAGASYTFACSTDGESCTINMTDALYRTSNPIASIWLVYNYTIPYQSTQYNASVQTLNTFEASAKFMPLVGIVIFGAVVLGLVSYFGMQE
jgi:hypothetical protein